MRTANGNLSVLCCGGLVLLALVASHATAQCNDACNGPNCQSYSLDNGDTETITSTSCGSGSVTLTSVYVSDSSDDDLTIAVCPVSSLSDSSCSNPIQTQTVSLSSSDQSCFEYYTPTELIGVDQVALVVYCNNNVESCSFTASLSFTCTPVAGTPFLQDFNSVCVGDGNAFTKALPCPADSSASCAYTVSATATSSHLYEGSPDASFIIFADSADYTNWNSNNPYNTVAGPITSSDSFNSGVFYVPPGSTYIFVAYNGNWREDMEVSGYVEFYPNTADGSQTNVPGQSASAFTGSALSSSQLFAFGFFLGLYDAEPFSPPTQTCTNGMSRCYSDANALVSAYSNGASGSALLSDLTTLINDFKSTMGACNANPSSCPGFNEEIISDVLSVAAQAIPGVDVIDDVTTGLELLYNGYNMITDIGAMENAYKAQDWYTVGYEAGSILLQLKAMGSDLSRRSVPTNATTRKLDLRHNDGVVRTLQQWRAMYNRTYLAAFDVPTATTTTSRTTSGPLAHPGAVAGLVVGAVAAVALIGVAVGVAVKRRRSARLPVANPAEKDLLTEFSSPYEPFRDEQ